AGKRQRTFVVVMAPVVQIPVALEKLFVVLQHDLPCREQLLRIARELTSDQPEAWPHGEALERVLDAAAGLPRSVPAGTCSLGVPGTGKSAFGKALGNETDRPTLLLDIGALMGSLVGQTEQNARQALRIADAMSPCILFADELEKALAGIGNNGDGGVSTRLF